MKTLEELIQEALDQGIVDVREDLPYTDVNGEWCALDAHKIRRFLEIALKPDEIDTQHYSELAEGVVKVTIPPSFFVDLLGYVEARQDNTGAVTLIDTKGGRHTAVLDQNISNMEWADICVGVEKCCQSV